MLFFQGYRVRLRFTLLLLLFVTSIIVIGGIWLLENYQKSFMLETERMLAVQGRQIASTYRLTFLNHTKGEVQSYGRPLPVDAKPELERSRTRWELPIRIQSLNLSKDSIHGPPPNADGGKPDEQAAIVGQTIKQLLIDTETSTLNTIHITDFKGIVVASTTLPHGASVINRPEVQSALNGTHHSLLRSQRSGQQRPIWGFSSFTVLPKIHSAVPIILGSNVIGAVLLSKHPPAVLRAIETKPYKIIKYAFAALVLLMLFSLATSWFITKPLSTLVGQIRRARREGIAVPKLQHPVTQEIEELSSEVTDMTNELHSHADYIRNFSTHVSHEFKNPLGAIQLTVDMLRTEAEHLSQSELDHFLSNIEIDTKRLLSLTNELNKYARASVLNVGVQEHCDINEVLESIAEQYHRHSLVVTIDSNADNSHAAMSRETLESVILSVLDNAAKHGAKTAALVAETDTRNKRLLLHIENDGTSISTANAERIFQPFFTTERDSGGTGLGLTIVKALLKAHGGDISLLPNKEKVTFQLGIPVY